MLDEKDLQAIQSMIDAAEQHIAKNTLILVDAEFKPVFSLMAEGIQDLRENAVPCSRVDELENEVKFLKTVIRQMNEDIFLLKQDN
jgi:hypothetical protein